MQETITFNCDFCKSACSRAKWEYNQTKNHFCSQKCAKAHRNQTIGPKVGDTRYSLTFVQKLKRTRGTFYLCKCECGKETTISRSKWGVTKTCGDRSVHTRGNLSKHYKGYKDISLSHWNSIKTQARNKNREFDLTIEFAWELFLRQGRRCALTGVELNLSKKNGQEITASLDRIDSNLGYIKSNVQWVHKTINKIKTDLNLHDFISWCLAVAKKKHIFQEKIDFNQVLLRPSPTTLKSRNDVDLSTHALSHLFPNTVPIIAANFDTVGSFAMAQTLTSLKLMTCLSKHYEAGQYVGFFKQNDTSRVFYSMGVNNNDLSKLRQVLKSVNVRNICIDVAHAETDQVCETITKVKELSPDSIIMVGNVATPDFIETFAKLGVNIIKVGIGSGAVCVTRLVAGVGVPQLSAVLDCVQEANRLGMYVCSDGGCVYPADIVKAFAAGSSMVMIGSMLSGTDECEGDWIEDSTGKYLIFYGMSSQTAMKKHQSNLSTYRASEGRTVKVKYKGPVRPIISQILGGLRSACTYSNARTLLDLPHQAEFIRVTHTHNSSFENITISL